MSAPHPVTVWQGLYASTQLRVLVFSVSVHLVLLEMADTLEMVVMVKINPNHRLASFKISQLYRSVLAHSP